jgi:DNA ligase-1
MVKFNTLYKRSTTGKVSLWQIEVEGNKFRTISGFNCGLKVTSDFTVCEAKSYCTAEEQAIKQATSLHKKKMELGAFENIKDIDNPILFEPMLAKDFDKEGHKIKYPIGSQGKLDGVRCVIKASGMWTRKGKPLVSTPHIWNSVKPLFEIYPDLILDGELYTDKLANDFNKIISCVRKTKPTKEDIEESAKFIEFWCYDCIDEDDLGFIDRYNNLSGKYNLESYKYCKILSTFTLKNKAEVIEQFKNYIIQGYEGQILRVLNSKYENKRTSSLIKHKDFKTEEFTIITVNEGVGKLANKVGTMTIITDDEILVDCAVNGTHEYLGEIWKNRGYYIGKLATVRYFDRTPDNSLRFPKIIDLDRDDI